MALGNGVKITWLGHSAFQVSTPEGKSLLLDPWLDNPKAPSDARQRLSAVDGILVTHGHYDHLGNTVELARQFKAKVVCIFEISVWLQSQGIPADNAIGMNKGGSYDLDGVRVTMVNANHSSGISGDEGIVPGGDPAGYVLRFGNGFTLYHSGDTNAFLDMQLIGRLYQPDVAMLPIGGFYTMDPREAAEACRMLGVKRVIPMHFGTFPALAGTPDQLRQELKDTQVEVVDLQPGQTLS